MIRSSSIFVFYFLLILYGCGNRRVSESKTIYKDSSFVVKTFYPDGSLLSEHEYQYENVRNSYYCKYYTNGRRKYCGWYKEGKQDSTWVWYYENGSIQTEGYWKNGEPYLVQRRFFPTGSLKEYLFYDIKGNLIFKSSFEENGTLIKEEGNPIPMIIADQYVFNTGDTLMAKVYVVSPPHYSKLTVLSKIDYEGASWDTLTLKDDHYPYIKPISFTEDSEWLVKVIINKTNSDIPVIYERDIVLKIDSAASK